MRRIAKTRQSLILCVISLKNITVILYILSFKKGPIYGWENNRGAGYLRRLRAHYDVTVMTFLEMSVENFQFCL